MFKDMLKKIGKVITEGSYYPAREVHVSYEYVSFNEVISEKRDQIESGKFFVKPENSILLCGKIVKLDGNRCMFQQWRETPGEQRQKITSIVIRRDMDSKIVAIHRKSTISSDTVTVRVI